MADLRTLPKSITDALRPVGQIAHVEQLAEEVAATMRLIHGGRWRVRIDHETHFISVRQA